MTDYLKLKGLIKATHTMLRELEIHKQFSSVSDQMYFTEMDLKKMEK